jgi:hypothetical protein
MQGFASFVGHSYLVAELFSGSDEWRQMPGYLEATAKDQAAQVGHQQQSESKVRDRVNTW